MAPRRAGAPARSAAAARLNPDGDDAMPPAGDDDDDDDATRAASAVSFDADLRDMTQRACRCEPATTTLSFVVCILYEVSAAAHFGATRTHGAERPSAFTPDRQ